MLTSQIRFRPCPTWIEFRGIAILGSFGFFLVDRGTSPIYVMLVYLLIAVAIWRQGKRQAVSVSASGIDGLFGSHPWDRVESVTAIDGVLEFKVYADSQSAGKVAPKTFYMNLGSYAVDAADLASVLISSTFDQRGRGLAPK